MPDLKSVLDASPVDNRVRADAWDAFEQASTEDDFKARFDKLPLPENTKADLWDLKFSGGKGSQQVSQPVPQSVPQGPREPQWYEAPTTLGKLNALRSANALKSAGLPSLSEMYDWAVPPNEKPSGVVGHAAEFARRIARTPAELADFVLTPEGALVAATGGASGLPSLLGKVAKRALPAIGAGFSTQMMKELVPIPGVPGSGQVGRAFVQSPGGGTAADVLKTGAMAVAPLAHGATAFRSRMPKFAENTPESEIGRLRRYREDAQAQAQAVAEQFRPQPMPPAPEVVTPAPQPTPRPVTTHGPRTLTGNMLMTDEAEIAAANAAMDRLESPRTEPMPSAPSMVPEERFQRYRDEAVAQGQEFSSAVERSSVPSRPMPEFPETPGFKPEQLGPPRPFSGNMLLDEKTQQQAAETAAAHLETTKGAAELPRMGPGRAEAAIPPAPEPPKPTEPGAVGRFLQEERGEIDYTRLAQVARDVARQTKGDFDAWRKAMVERFGPGIEGQLLLLWNEQKKSEQPAPGEMPPVPPAFTQRVNAAVRQDAMVEANRRGPSVKPLTAQKLETAINPPTPPEAPQPVKPGKVINIADRRPAATAPEATGVVSQILATHQQTGGSTFNLRSGQNLAGQKFYSVSPFKELERIIDHDPTSEDITSFMRSPGVREKLFDPSGEYGLGTWKDSESGQTYLDVVVTTPKLERAMEIGRSSKQIAAFDLSKVNPATGEVAEGAEIPISEPMTKLYHWSRRPDLEILEPSKYGTAEAGAEMRRRENAGPDWVDRTYYTDRPEPVEPGRFGPGTRSPHQYEAEIPESRIYDLTKDPDGLRAGEGDITRVEKRIRDLGYAGYKGAYPDGTPAYAVFEPLKVSLRERLEQAAQDAMGRIKERQEAMPRESLLTGEAGASTAGMNFVDMSIWGASKLMLKTMDFAQWSKEMLRDFPQLANDQLEKLYKRSQWVLSNHVERTADGLPSMKKLTKLYEQGKDFKDWYQKSHDEVKAMFGEDSDMFLSMLAATSPMSSVRSNTVLALKAYEQWKTGKPFDGFIENIRVLLTRLASGDPNWANPETAPKVHNFDRALHGDPSAFTVDRWWGKEFGFGEKFGTSRYKFMDYAGTQIAHKLGVPVREYQAAGWSAIKEKLADLDFASDDFSVVLREVLQENPTLAKYIKADPKVLEEIRAKATEAAEAPPDWVTQPMEKVVPKRRALGSERGALNVGEIAGSIGDAVNWWERKMIDDLSDIRRFTSKANLPAEMDPYKLAILHAGRGGKVLRRLTRKGGLREIIRPAYKEGLLKDVTDYALLERYEELAGRGISEFPGGKTLPQIQAEKAAMEARLGPQKLARVQSYIQRLYGYSDQILQEARDGGLISPKTYTQIKNTNQKYMPLQRLAYVADQLDQMRPGSNIFSVPAQNLVKAIHGSEKQIVDPIQGIINNTIKSVGLISRNRVALKMADLANNPDFKGQVIHLQKGMQAPDGFDTFSVLREGRKEVYAVPQVVADAMKRLNPEQADFLSRTMASSSALLKGGAVTFNMAFIPANALRDFATATLKSEVGFYPWDWVRGVGRAVFKGDVYDQYLESGGAFGGYMGQFTSIPGAVKEMTGQFTLKKALSIANPLEYVKALGTIIEQAPRIGAFERAIKKGKSPEGAGYLSRDVTVNFSKSGSAMRVLNLWVPFLNARQQGMLNTFRAVEDHPGRSAAILTAMVGVPAVLTYLHNTRQHADVWNDIADFEKRNYFVVIYGDDRDKDGNPTQVIKIPKGDVGQVFGNPLEHFLAWKDGKETKSLSRLALEVGSDINPVPFEREGKVSGLAVGSSMTPPTLKALGESWTNKNWYTGREIVGQKHRLREGSPGEQYWTDTPKAAVSFGKFFGISPKHVQNFVGTQFGGLGRQAMYALSGEPGKASETVTRRFSGARGGAQEQREFEDIGKIRQESADEQIRRNRDVQVLFDEMDKLPPEQRRDRFTAAVQAGKFDEKGLETFASLIEAKALGLTDSERLLKSSSTGDRATYIKRKLESLPQDQKAATFQRWVDKGILTEDVAEAMVVLIQGQQ